MTNILLILFFVLLFLLFFYSKRNEILAKKTRINPTYKLFLKEQEFNPDISTDNWDLHKLRLDKFKLSLIHISEPTRLGMISYAVFCLKKKNKN